MIIAAPQCAQTKHGLSRSMPLLVFSREIAAVRISAIVDACFRLIVDGRLALPLTRGGSAQVLF